MAAAGKQRHHHPDTLHCLNNLALCLGDSSRVKLTVLHALVPAPVLQDQGKLKEAEQLLRRGLPFHWE